MEYMTLENNCRMYEFDPNVKYDTASSLEKKLFNFFLKQYAWEKYADDIYNRGKHHIYMIFSYKENESEICGFIHVLECDDISKDWIRKCHCVSERFFTGNVVFIHTIKVQRKFRRKGYATYMVEVVKRRFAKKANLMVEATKKGKRFWPAVGFVETNKTFKGKFMIYQSGLTDNANDK